MSKTFHSDKCQLTIVGEWWDELYSRRPDGSLQLDWKSPVRYNTKMDNAAILIAALLANDAGTSGLLFSAQGIGDAVWVEPTIPAVNTADTTLLSEAGRNPINSIVFLDGADLPTVTLTNKILVSTTFIEADLAGVTIREQALFGGDATATVDTGIILNVIRHDPLFKSGAAILTRNIKITFS